MNERERSETYTKWIDRCPYERCGKAKKKGGKRKGAKRPSALKVAAYSPPGDFTEWERRSGDLKSGKSDGLEGEVEARPATGSIACMSSLSGYREEISIRRIYKVGHWSKWQRMSRAERLDRGCNRGCTISCLHCQLNWNWIFWFDFRAKKSKYLPKTTTESWHWTLSKSGIQPYFSSVDPVFLTGAGNRRSLVRGIWGKLRGIWC